MPFGMESPLRLFSNKNIMVRGRDKGIDIQKELTFKKFKLLPEIVDVLENDLNIRAPTPIQKLAIPHLIKGNSALLAA